MTQRTFRDALLAYVADNDISLRKIAEGSGVSYEQLKKLSQNKSRSTNVDDAAKIVKFLGTSLDEFLGDVDVSVRNEIVQLYNQLSEHERDYLLKSAQGLASARHEADQESQ